jgi:hypothetical protein
MFMVAMVHGPFGFRFGFSALFRNSEFEFREAQPGGQWT